MHKGWYEIRLRFRKSTVSTYITCNPGFGAQTSHQLTNSVLYWCEKCNTHVCWKHWKTHDYSHILERLGGKT